MKTMKKRIEALENRTEAFAENWKCLLNRVRRLELQGSGVTVNDYTQTIGFPGDWVLSYKDSLDWLGNKGLDVTTWRLGPFKFGLKQGWTILKGAKEWTGDDEASAEEAKE